MNKLEYLFKTHTLRGRLRTFIINLILFVVLVISIFLMFMTKSQIKLTYQNELNSIIKMQNQTIEKWLNERELDIRFLVNSEDVKNNNLKKTKILFENFVNSQSEFYFVSLINLEGHSIVNSTFDNKQFFGDEVFFKDNLDGLDAISDASLTEVNNMPLIHFSSPVLNKYNDVIAVVVGAVRLSSIQAIVENFRFGKTGETYIINAKKQLLTKRKYDKKNKILHEKDLTKIKKDFYESYSKNEVLGTFEKSNFGRWIIVAEISKDEMHEMFEQFLIYVSIFIIILLVLIIPLILRFSNKIEKPLQFLLHGSKQIQDGDYGHEIDSSLITHATNEIKDLTSSFNSMSNVLKSVIGELTRQSTTDVLTKLYNRRELLRLSINAYKSSIEDNKHFSILMIDIDHFKKINDSYGHDCGDFVLKTFGQILKMLTRNEDKVVRYGGEEFVALIRYDEEKDVLKYIKRIKNLIEKNNFVFNDIKIKIKFCAGVSLRQNYDSYDKTISFADKLLYKAKHTGRNKIILDDNTIL